VVVEGRNLPVDWIVAVRTLARLAGDDVSVMATLVGGDETLSTWTADFTLIDGHLTLQVRAAKP